MIAKKRAAKRGPGRPPTLAAPRTSGVLVRLTAAERDELGRQAAALGVSAPELARRRVVAP
jgi:hypothetical protein